MWTRTRSVSVLLAADGVFLKLKLGSTSLVSSYSASISAKYPDWADSGSWEVLVEISGSTPLRFSVLYFWSGSLSSLGRVPAVKVDLWCLGCYEFRFFVFDLVLLRKTWDVRLGPKNLCDGSTLLFVWSLRCRRSRDHRKKRNRSVVLLDGVSLLPQLSFSCSQLESTRGNRRTPKAADRLRPFGRSFKALKECSTEWKVRRPLSVLMVPSEITFLQLQHHFSVRSFLLEDVLHYGYALQKSCRPDFTFVNFTLKWTPE